MLTNSKQHFFVLEQPDGSLTLHHDEVDLTQESVTVVVNDNDGYGTVEFMSDRITINPANNESFTCSIRTAMRVLDQAGETDASDWIPDSGID